MEKLNGSRDFLDHLEVITFDQNGYFAEFSPPFGAGVIFDAERLHAVAPISEGQRLVLVVEFCESIGLAVVPALYISRTSMPTAYPH